MKVSISKDDSFFGRLLCMAPKDDITEFAEIVCNANKDREPGEFDIVITTCGVDITEHMEASGWSLTERYLEHYRGEAAKAKREMEELNKSKEAMDYAIKDKAETLIAERCEKIYNMMGEMQEQSWEILRGKANNNFVNTVSRLLEELAENPTVSKQGTYRELKEAIAELPGRGD